MLDRSQERPGDPNQPAHQVFLQSIGEAPKFDPAQVAPVAPKERSQIAAKAAESRWGKKQ